jgi:putative heme-binding domain-containing protein
MGLTRRSDRSAIAFLTAAGVAAAVAASSALAGDEPAKAADSPMVKLLRGGKVPAERQGTVIDMIGKRGSADDLGYLLGRALEPEGFTPANRLKALEALSEAALTRGLRPAGDLGRLVPLVEAKAGGDPSGRLVAVRLAGLWKAAALGGALRTIAEAADTPEPLRAAALDALAAIGGTEGRASIEALTAAGKPLAVRAEAVAALTRLDVDAAAGRAAAVLRDADAGKGATQDDLEPLLAAFLNRRGGADKLAAALGQNPVPADAAKLALRAVYALGHSEAPLVAALTKAAGIDAEVKPLDKAAIDRLIADVAAQGDPVRGERLFRRADLNCTKCHAVSGAGGGVGPDLSALGSSSPVDYIIHSIMLPDQAIKEEFLTLTVQTADGQVFQGIVADKDDKRVVLKEATGELRTIPTADIEDTKEGGSLMPKGLVNFVTRAEFVDLVRFLSELGKPGPFAVRSTPTVQRWRWLKPVPDALARSVPDPSTFRALVLGADAARWLPAYARTAGDLPLGELTPEAGKVLYLQGEVEVSHGGTVLVKLNSASGVTAWVDDQPAPAFSGSGFTTELSAGRHKLTFLADTAARGDVPLRVEVLKPAGSSAAYDVVGGR